MSGPQAAIFFKPEGYVLDGPKLMGRHAAGNGFLRAAVAASRNRPIYAFAANRQEAKVFVETVKAIDPAANPRWIPANQFDQLGKLGTLYLPDPNVVDASRLRLRVGVAAYSLAGITHTIAAHRAMDAIAGLLSAPVMPWDALVCTSQSVVKTFRILLDAEVEYLKWRLGASRFVLPQLPVIPLGVHCDDFVFAEGEREAARRELQIDDDTVVVLFVGRLSSHAKAHPYPMYVALEAAAVRTGRKLALIQCGWFANEPTRQAFHNGAARFSPSCQVLWTDGRSAAERRRSWAAADIFMSLADNIQETFGITPIEAMAAGLPSIVTDWDGYRETVREGVDGFRIPTWLPPDKLGEAFALRYETGVFDYDVYCGAASQTTSIDDRILVDRLCELAVNPALRRQFGAAGRKRAREVYDWSVVFRQYQALWGHLAEIRAKPDPGLIAGAPRSATSRMNPFVAFAHYPTRHMSHEVVVARSPGRVSWEELARHAFFLPITGALAPKDHVETILAALERRGPLSIGQLAQDLHRPVDAVSLTVSALAKMGVVALQTLNGSIHAGARTEILAPASGPDTPSQIR